MLLSGLLTVRNGNTLDYCWRESVASMLGCCDEVVINDVQSDDGTWPDIQALATKDSRITIFQSPWTDPKADTMWWPKTLNIGRDRASSKMVLHLDADEVLHEQDYPGIRDSAKAGSTLYFHRYNFWKDPQHLVPSGQCCGVRVLRMCERHMHLPSDYPYRPAESTEQIAQISNFKIYHYGFLRKREAFFAKTRSVQRIWANDYDVRLTQAEKDPQNWATNPCVSDWVTQLVSYDGNHPTVIHEWLKERGYNLQ